MKRGREERERNMKIERGRGNKGRKRREKGRKREENKVERK